MLRVFASYLFERFRKRADIELKLTDNLFFGEGVIYSSFSDLLPADKQRKMVYDILGD